MKNLAPWYTYLISSVIAGVAYIVTYFTVQGGVLIDVLIVAVGILLAGIPPYGAAEDKEKVSNFVMGVAGGAITVAVASLLGYFCT